MFMLKYSLKDAGANAQAPIMEITFSATDGEEAKKRAGDFKKAAQQIGLEVVIYKLYEEVKKC